MTESEWLASTDPTAMLAALRRLGEPSERKLRLFATACCRRVQGVLTDPATLAGIATAERYVEGEATHEEWERAVAEVREAEFWAWCEGFVSGPRSDRIWLVEHPATVAVTAALGGRTVGEVSAAAVAAVVQAFGVWGGPREEEFSGRERASQCRLLRDIFGNPFRLKLPLSPCFLTSNAAPLHLAQAAYGYQVPPLGTLDSVRLAILADALEEAGCTDAALLAHLRASGPHVRGCWALDLILERG